MTIENEINTAQSLDSRQGETMPKGIALKLVKTLQIIKNPQKSAYLSMYNFKYSNRDDVAAVVKPALSEAGLLIQSRIRSYSRESVNGKYYFYTAIVEISLIDCDTGECWRYDIPAEAYEQNDKALPKCLTSAIRHWAINNFWLSDGGEEGLYYESPDPTMEPPGKNRQNNNRNQIEGMITQQRAPRRKDNSPPRNIEAINQQKPEPRKEPFDFEKEYSAFAGKAKDAFDYDEDYTDLFLEMCFKDKSKLNAEYLNKLNDSLSKKTIGQLKAAVDAYVRDRDNAPARKEA